MKGLTTISTLEPGANPYVGPRTFTYEQRTLFFGREREARDLLARVSSTRLLLFYAQSGAGKSSLLHTRLIPGLRDEAGFAVMPVGRVAGALPAGVDAVDNIFVFNLLASLDQGGGEPAQLARLTLVDFLAGLVSDDGHTWRYEPALAEPPAAGAYAAQRYVLIVDQFEDIITTNPGRWAERERFFRQLNDALEADPNLWVVLTLREDYLAALDPYARLMADKLSGRFYMERMGIDTALEAIHKPAELGGRPFAPGVAQQLVDNLRQVRVPGQSEPQLGQYVEPVQLQVVCYQLWENLQGRPPGPITAGDLQEAGDVDSALAAFYATAVAQVVNTPQVGVSERGLRTWFSTQLITPAGTRSILFRNEQTGETEGLPNAAVDVLARQFLLRSELRAGGTWVELVHDRFVEPILTANRDWLQKYQLRNPLVVPTQAWLVAERAEAKLLTGLQMREAAAYAEAHPGELVEAELTFLDESRRQVERAHIRRRNRLLAALAAATALILLTLWALYNAAESQRQARLAKARELAAAATANLILDPDRSLLLALQAQDIQAIPEAEYALRQALLAQRVQARDENPEVVFWDLAVADHQSRQLVAAGSDNTLYFWEPATGKAITLTASSEGWSGGYLPVQSADGTEVGPDLEAMEGTIVAIDVAPDGSRLVAGSTDGTLTMWSLRSRQRLYSLQAHEDQVLDVAFRPGGTAFATAGRDGVVQLWDTGDGSRLPARLTESNALVGLAFHPDGNRLAIASADQRVIIWELPVQSPLGAGEAPDTQPSVIYLQGHDDLVYRVAYSPDGSQLASVSEDKSVILWDVSDPQAQPMEQARLYDHTDAVTAVDFSPNGKCLATGSLDRTARLWDATSGRLLLTLQHADGVRGLAFFPDDLPAGDLPTERCAARLATATVGGALQLWNTGPTGEDRILAGHTQAVEWVTYSPDGVRLATASSDGTARVWDVATGEQILRLPHAKRVNRVVYSPDGAQLATASYDGTAILWDTASGKALHVLQHGDWVLGVDFRPDGKLLATACADGSVSLWDVASGKLVEHVPLYAADVEIFDVAFSRDGTLLAAATGNKETLLIRLDPSELIAELEHDAPIYDVAFSPDGKSLATAGWDAIAKLWSASSPWTRQAVLANHSDRLYSVGYSRDDRFLATAGADRTVTVWDIAAGQVVHVLPGAAEELNSAAFSPDGAQVAVSSDDGTVRLYWLRAEPLREAARARLTRWWTQAECEQYLKEAACPQDFRASTLPLSLAPQQQAFAPSLLKEMSP